MIIIILLAIIACVLLFGKEKTKSGIGDIIFVILFLAFIGSIVSCFG